MDPHADQPVETMGPAPGDGRAVVIMVHGRGAAPPNILDLVGPLHHPAVTWMAPAAAGRTWYPYSFLSDIEKNEPGLTSGLRVLDRLVRGAIKAGVPRERVVLLGFSQGACLASEYVVRHAARFGGLVAFSGGLIGPPGTTWPYGGHFDGMPVFLGCSDSDAHVPKERVDETATVLTRMGAVVDERIYPGMGHLVNDDELAAAHALIAGVAASGVG